ncbi:hypothetical protein PlfCFBP13513_04165 [Plantibacter flavus]|uniref:nucleotidyltransferase domain-containing protein n=1 Tax=Plantibacter flavus TaxID=150123 RepID=UPI0010C19E70|nr:nucleotidyltransferase domain-containing protein [Plantibacter flavus]TKJ98646.1 hypothetical protein PlfCFBP13513_04165 [Plantibacter flavus]
MQMAWPAAIVVHARYPPIMGPIHERSDEHTWLIKMVGSGGNEALAAMVYGSYARGTHDEDSDIDVLELVAADPAPYSRGRVNVTQYTPSHLGQMAQRGSLFVSHLLTDGVPLIDPHRIMERALAQYRPPESYDPIWKQLSIAAGAINPAAPDAERFTDGLCRLAIYTLRTAIYLRALENGAPCFDLDLAAQRTGVPGLTEVLRWRRIDHFSTNHLRSLAEMLPKVLSSPIETQPRSTVSYAVAHASSPDMAALFATVLGEGKIAYSALTVPPF